MLFQDKIDLYQNHICIDNDYYDVKTKRSSMTREKENIQKPVLKLTINK